jgi:membrane protein implicated in regulation of membrane protease activity
MLLSVLLYGLIRVRTRTRGPLVEPDRSAVGCVGPLTIATRGTAGPGEVLLRIRGGSETYLAWSDEPLKVGTTVLVIEARGSRTVEVVPWVGEPDPSITSPESY